MAKIVLGMGASHGPLLATPPEQWGGRVEADEWQVGLPVCRRPTVHFSGGGCRCGTGRQ